LVAAISHWLLDQAIESSINLINKAMKYLLCCVALCCALSGFAQNKDKDQFKKAYQKLHQVDSRSFKTQNFLNKGFFLGRGLRNFARFAQGNAKVNYVFNSPYQWKAYRRGIARAKFTKTKPPKIKKILAKYKAQKDVVPLGILQAQGEWLRRYEIDENIKAKKQGYALAKNYAVMGIYSGSVLKKKVYSGKVAFEIVPELFQIENPAQIQSIAVDAGDGKGFRMVQAGDHFAVEYKGTGDKAIAVKFSLAQGDEFVSYSQLNVVTLKRKKPDHVFKLRSQSVNGRSTGLNGGTAELYASDCDYSFNRPVIIVEGYDPLNEMDINWFSQKYRIDLPGVDRSIEDLLGLNGYDVIYLDFADGGADIRANAKVLEELINEVNRLKTGNLPITIIGESMGGLVSRYALTDMERRGRTHNVGRYISFDSPHKGANVPAGFQTLIQSISQVDFVNVFNIAQSSIQKAFRMLDAPAARQMLLRHKGANPHPDFVAFQNELNALGFPKQGGIRNISIVNGAANGTGQGYTPSNLILDIRWISALPLLNGVIKVYTNSLNTHAKVSSLLILTGVAPTTIRERSHWFDVNYDVAPGGRQDNQGAGGYYTGTFDLNIVHWFGKTIKDYGRGHFSFIPTFSGVASNAPINSQTDLFRSISSLQAEGHVPFDAVYSRNNNTKHLETYEMATPWFSLLQNELGMTISGGCQVSSGQSIAPPKPAYNGAKFYKCASEKISFTITNHHPKISNLYRYVWRLTGPWNQIQPGGNTYHFGSVPAGLYTLKLERYYGAATSLHSPPSSVSYTIRVYADDDPTYGCGNNTGGGGDPDPVLGGGGGSTGGGGIILIDNPMQRQARIPQITEVKVYPNPVQVALQVQYTLKQAGKMSIKLTPMQAGGSQGAATITQSYRPAGKYHETYRTDRLKGGWYVLTLETSEDIVRKKIFIQK
jgi:pimeloyl-ACP methyl ester carboxylesterase